MKNFKFILLLFVILLVASCRKELPLPDLNAANIIVINSVFNVTDNLEVHVSNSCHIKSENCLLDFVPDAQVVLKDGSNNQLASLTHQGNGVYTAPGLTMESEENYHLEVTGPAPDQVKLSGKSKIPKAISCTYIGAEERIYSEDVTWSFEVEIDDDPEEKNYYLLEGYYDLGDHEHHNGTNEVNNYEIPHFVHYTSDINSENRDIYAAYDYLEYGLRTVYLTDENFNGQKYKAQFAIGDFDLLIVPLDSVKAMLSIKSVSEEMYLHHKSIETHLFSQSSFFSEPTTIYSNIENGAGIFGAYSEQKMEIMLPKSRYFWPQGAIIENNECTGPCEVSFSTSGGIGINYLWDFGDGNTSTEPNPSHTYTQAGSYNVKLTAGLGFDDITSDYEVIIR